MKDLQKLIENSTHQITDKNLNKWEVIEVSDLEDIMQIYHQAQLKLLGLQNVSGSAWGLPDGVYQVGFDKAAKGSKSHSCRVWMKKGISGEMIIVAEEHYR